MKQTGYWSHLHALLTMSLLNHVRDMNGHTNSEHCSVDLKQTRLLMFSNICAGALEQVFDTSRYSGTHTLTISAIDLQGRIARYTYTTGMLGFTCECVIGSVRIKYCPLLSLQLKKQQVCWSEVK